MRRWPFMSRPAPPAPTPCVFRGGPLDDKVLMLSVQAKYYEVPVLAVGGFARIRYTCAGCDPQGRRVFTTDYKEQS